jgi:AraC-like DNA-binding protein
MVDARYAEPLTVDDLATAAHMSRAHFSREFRRAFGESPYSYILTRRLERAALLLRTTERPILDVCMSVGLSSVGSFTSSFRKAFGASPAVYRDSSAVAPGAAAIPQCLLRSHGRPVATR